MFVCYSCSVCIASRECADDVSCLREQGVQRYANTYVDRQVGKSMNISWSYDVRFLSCTEGAKMAVM